MIRKLCLGLIALALAASTAPVYAGDNLDPLIVKHAAAHNLPESLVRRVIKRESGGNARLVSRGNYGLMQIRLGTARAMGYDGSPQGLLDPDTNMTYAVKYLAGAYRTANGDADRAVRYYQTGYYYAAKRGGLAHTATRTQPRESRSPTILERVVKALTSRAEAAPSRKHLRKVRRARDANVASSSSLYSGRRDYF